MAAGRRPRQAPRQTIPRMARGAGLALTCTFELKGPVPRWEQGWEGSALRASEIILLIPRMEPPFTGVQLLVCMFAPRRGEGPALPLFAAPPPHLSPM